MAQEFYHLINDAVAILVVFMGILLSSLKTYI